MLFEIICSLSIFVFFAIISLWMFAGISPNILYYYGRLWISVQIARIKLWCRDRLIKFIGSGLISETNDVLIVTYFIRENKYTIIIPKSKGPRSIRNVYIIKDNDNVDLTDKIRTYLGPYGDFHRIPTTPKMLGYDGLVVNSRIGTTIYSANEVIKV